MIIELALMSKVQENLTPDLLRADYISQKHILGGHCYVASEALYWLLGGPESDWCPQSVNHEGATHWYLQNRVSGDVLDPTAQQFRKPVPYKSGRGRGFLTSRPSKRAKELIGRLTTLNTLCSREKRGK